MKEALKFLNKRLTIRWYLLNPGYTTTVLLKSNTAFDVNILSAI